MLGVANEPTSAITAELANKCRGLATKAYPYKQPGQIGGGNAEAQRGYFKECVARGANIGTDESGTGQSDHGEPPVSAPPK
jgi:hypothetical protein